MIHNSPSNTIGQGIFAVRYIYTFFFHVFKCECSSLFFYNKKCSLVLCLGMQFAVVPEWRPMCGGSPRLFPSSAQMINDSPPRLISHQAQQIVSGTD